MKRFHNLILFSGLLLLVQSAFGFERDQLAVEQNRACAIINKDQLNCITHRTRPPTNDGYSPQPPTVTPAKGLTHVVAGFGHSCLLFENGLVKCWGDNSYHQANPSGTEYVQLAGVATQIAAGALHTCALLLDGRTQCWGYGPALGPDYENGGPDGPVFVTGLRGKAKSISAGALHSCAVLMDGTAQCWGYGNDAQLGDGIERVIYASNSYVYESVRGHAARLRADQLHVSSLPVFVKLPPNFKAKKISGKVYHSCALSEDDRVYCWGKVEGAKFAIAVSGDLDPARIHGLKDVVDVDAGGEMSCALIKDGTVSCWIGSTAPWKVAGLTADVIGIDVGRSSACAKLSNQKIMCWGGSPFGKPRYEYELEKVRYRTAFERSFTP